VVQAVATVVASYPPEEQVNVNAVVPELVLDRGNRMEIGFTKESHKLIVKADGDKIYKSPKELDLHGFCGKPGVERFKSLAVYYLKAAMSQFDVFEQSDLTTELLAEMVWQAKKFQSAKLMFQVKHNTHSPATIKKFMDEFLAAVFSHKSFWMTMVLSTLEMEIEPNHFVAKINKWIEAHQSTKARKADERRKRNQAKALEGKALESNAPAAAGFSSSEGKRRRLKAPQSDSDESHAGH